MKIHILRTKKFYNIGPRLQPVGIYCWMCMIIQMLKNDDRTSLYIILKTILTFSDKNKDSLIERKAQTEFLLTPLHPA